MKHTFVYLISEIRSILTAAKINKCLSIYCQGLLLFFSCFFSVLSLALMCFTFLAEETIAFLKQIQELYI